MINALLVIPMPNQKMANGIQATGGIGRTISKIGRANPSTTLNHPIANPRGIPIARAIM